MVLKKHGNVKDSLALTHVYNVDYIIGLYFSLTPLSFQEAVEMPIVSLVG